MKRKTEFIGLRIEPEIKKKMKKEAKKNKLTMSEFVIMLWKQTQWEG